MFCLTDSTSRCIRSTQGSPVFRYITAKLVLAAAMALAQLPAVANPGSLIITCRPDKSVTCNTTWTFDAPTATNGCGPVTVTELFTSDPVATCGKSYTLTRAWNVSDGCESNTCSQTVTVRAKAPDIDCAPDKTVEWGTAWDFDKPKLNISSCGNDDVDVDTIYTITNALCGRSYQVTRKWEAKDLCGNKDSCKQVVTVLDTSTGPVIVPKADKTVQCGDAWSFDAPTAYDSFDGTPLAVTPISNVTNLASRSMLAACTWETADGCGRIARCTQSVTIQDLNPPVLVILPNRTVELGVPWTFDTPTVTDGCFGTGVDLHVMETVTNLARGLAFSATRSWGASDPVGNNSTVSQTVTVTDSTPPTLTVPGDLHVIAGDAWVFGTPTATDAGGAVTVVIDSTTTNRSCGGSYVAVRTWRATDPSGNVTIGWQTVVVTDDTAPTLTCSAARTVEAGVAWNFDAPVSFDLGEGGSVPVTVVSTLTNAVSGRLNVTRLWRATDGCGNSAECTQTISVVDTTPPTIVVPADLNVRAGTAWVFGTPTTTDAGGAVTLAVESTITNRTCGASLVAKRSWRATDLAGNSALGSQTVTVTDDEAPTLACAASKTVEAGSEWSFEAPEAFDLGEGISIAATILSTSTNNLPDGQVDVTRVWRAVDACGNAAQCSQTVSLVDTVPPTLVVPADFRVRLGTAWAFGVATATDAGSAVTVDVVETITNSNCGGSFVARRTWKATDASGNSALGTQAVTVSDDQAPTLNCGAPKTVEAGSEWSFDEATAFKVVNGVNTPIPVTIISTTTNNISSSGLTLVTRVFHVSDACDNAVECSQVITVIDTTPPVFVSVPPGALYHCFADVPSAPILEAMDAGDGQLFATCTTSTNGKCPAYIVNTWTAMDLHGNRAFATQTHMVSVNPPRILSEPSNRTTCAGERVELCLELADACSVTYEWTKDGLPLTGATGSCLVFESVTVEDAGEYCVRVSGNFCPESEPQLVRCATLVVHPSLFVAPLDNTTVRVGQTVSFRADVTGPVSASTKVWRRNGIVIPGEAGATLTIAAARVADAGLYSVEVQAFCGNVSQSAVLAVVDPAANNTAPVISPIADRALQHNESTGRIPFTVSDAESAPETLVMSVISSDPMLLPEENILLAGAGANRTVLVVAPSAGSGQVTVTLLVSDGSDTGRRSFNVTIGAVAPHSRLSICLHGNGTVVPDLNGQELVLGQSYTVRAVHGPGHMFTGWTGEASSTEPVLTFVMTPNLMLNVGFAPNPYLTMPGTYNGLFHEADEVRHDTSGFLTLTRNAKGKYSGTLLTGGARVRFSGQFDALGNATNVIRRGKAAPYTAELHIGAGDRPDEISGGISRSAWTAGIMADRAAFHAVTNKAPYTGRYTLLIPGHALDGTAPAGDGFATLTVAAGGRVTFAGTLADGRKVAQRVGLGRLGDWPLYAALYSGRGSLLSWQTFGNRPTEDVGGLMSWIRPALTNAPSFRSGYSLDTAITGSRFVKPAAGHRVLNFSDGAVAFSDGQSEGYANLVTLGTDNKVVNHGENPLQLVVNRANGLFHGVVVNPNTGAKETFKGALLQKQNRGAGFCPGTNGVGRVIFQALP